MYIHKGTEVFASNLTFLIPIYLQPDANLCYFKLRLFDQNLQFDISKVMTVGLKIKLRINENITSGLLHNTCNIKT